MANLICDRIAGDESLESICRADDMPGSSTVRQWLRKHPEFAANYARAREEQGHSAADTLSDIRKKVLSGEIPPDVARAAADIAKWESARRAPKHFGDRILHGSDPQNPLPTPAVLDASKLSAQTLREVIEAAKANEANPS
jgi:hypothetical protein